MDVQLLGDLHEGSALEVVAHEHGARGVVGAHALDGAGQVQQGLLALTDGEQGLRVLVDINDPLENLVIELFAGGAARVAGAVGEVPVDAARDEGEKAAALALVQRQIVLPDVQHDVVQGVFDVGLAKGP